MNNNFYLQTGDLTGSSTSTTLSFYSSKELINTIITEEGVEQIFKEYPTYTYTSYFASQPEPKITKDIYRIVDGKLKFIETIEGKYLPARDESYEF